MITRAKYILKYNENLSTINLFFIAKTFSNDLAAGMNFIGFTCPI